MHFVRNPSLRIVEIIIPSIDLVARIALDELLSAGLQFELSALIRFFLSELLHLALRCLLLAIVGRLLPKAASVGIGVLWIALRLIQRRLVERRRAIGGIGKCIGN